MGESRITLAHGSGGEMTQELIAKYFLGMGGAASECDLEDAAILEVGGERLAFTTDSFVVTPRKFPGGDIGKLAVCGTVNDLASMGAAPLALSLAFIIEEGFSEEEFAEIVGQVKLTAGVASAPVITGDTKVVERGAADGLFINTAGVGRVHPSAQISARNAKPGDKVFVTGPVGDHGLAILAARHQLGGLQGPRSDCAPLWSLAKALLDEVGLELHCLRDPTRGGVAAVVNEIARQSNVGMRLDIPDTVVSPSTRGACELLGLDPLSLANEGKFVAIVSPEAADAAFERMLCHALGHQGALIGTVVEDAKCRVTMRTPLGAERLVEMPSGEILPRIC